MMSRARMIVNATSYRHRMPGEPGTGDYIETALSVEVPDAYFDLSASELDAMPTLAQGQADDLKIDNGDGFRVYLSHVGAEDGMPFDNAVAVEHYDGRAWIEVAVYEANA